MDLISQTGTIWSLELRTWDNLMDSNPGSAFIRSIRHFVSTVRRYIDRILMEGASELKNKTSGCNSSDSLNSNSWNTREEWTRWSRDFPADFWLKRKIGFTHKLAMRCKFWQSKCTLFTLRIGKYLNTFSQSLSGNSDQHVGYWKIFQNITWLTLKFMTKMGYWNIFLGSSWTPLIQACSLI